MHDLKTIKQMADIWGVKTVTIRKYISNGKLPEAYKIGRDWVIPADTPIPLDRRFVDKPVRNRRKEKT